MIKAIENRHNMYNDTFRYIEEKEAAGEILVLRPEEALPIKRTSRDLEKIKQVYEIGRQTGMKNIDIIKDFLAD